MTDYTKMTDVERLDEWDKLCCEYYHAQIGNDPELVKDIINNINALAQLIWG